MRIIGKAGLVLMAAGTLAFAPMPAEAAQLVLAPAVGDAPTGTYNVTPSCTVAPGVAATFDEITFTVAGDAQASSRTGALPVATGISCWIEDTITHVAYGPRSAAMPGPTAVVAGTITVPFNGSYRLCGEANALFNDNMVATGVTPPCHSLRS
jgi:hypothetical protein